MEADEFRKMLEEDPELAQSLKEALKGNAGAEELSGILTGARVDAATVEALLAEYQLKRGAVISAQELDDDELEHVAGCGTGVSCSSSDDCDANYKNPKYFDEEHCSYDETCDQYFYPREG